MKVKFDIKLQLINLLIHTRKYERYFEIGIDKGNCFKKVQVLYKVGVDPYVESYFNGYESLWSKTSDDYFKAYGGVKQFDIVLIDGMHLCEYALRDFINSYWCLKDRGCILLHDCNPPNERQASRERFDAVWNGDVWKVIWFLDKYFEGLIIKMFDTDQGITLVDFEDKVYVPSVQPKHFDEMINLPFSEIDKVREKYLVEPELIIG